MKLSLRRAGGTPPGLRGRLSGSGGFASVGVVAVLVGSMLATVFGAGAASRVLNISDGNVWLWSSQKGEAGRVNTASGKVDQRVPLTDAHGHRVQITQTDKHVLIRDLDTGKISSLDLNQLGGAHAAQGPKGANVRVVMAGESAFLVDNLAGQLQQIDPTTLAKVGAPVSFPPTLAGGVADQTGRVWFAVPSQGTVVAVSANGTGGSDAAAAEAANTTGKGAQVTASAKVGAPNHTYAMTALKSGAAVIDTTDGRISTVNSNKVASVVQSPIRGPVLVPDHTDGIIPITQPSSRTVFLVNGLTVSKVTIPGKGENLGAAVVFAGRMYVADNTSHTVQVTGLAGEQATPIDIPDANGPIELEVREDHLVINAPSSPHAVVVDGQGGRLNVDKYPPDIPGATDQGEAQAPPTNPNPNPVGGGTAGGTPTPGNGNGNGQNNGGNGPNTPALTQPGSVPALQASAGNKSVQLSWRRPTSGGAVNSYVISAPGRSSIVVPSGRRSATVDGLTNGVEYRFSVTARNRVGSGPESMANPVTPTGDVPGIPTNVTATAQKDGSVTVNWTEPQDKGPGILRYDVTAVGTGTTSQPFEGHGNSISIAAGNGLEYGSSYAFTVTASGLAVAGQPSQPSGQVIPFAKPDKPAVSAGDTKADSVTFNWTTPKENGRPISAYAAMANGKPVPVAVGQTSYTVTNLQPNTHVTFSLTATNEAGDSDPGQAETTTDNPVPTIQSVDGGTSGSYTKARVTFKVNWNGGQAGTCKITIDGKNAGTSCANGEVTVDRASKDYPYTIVATSPTGKTDKSTGNASSQLFTIHNSCDNSAAGDNCGLGILAKVPTTDPDKGPAPKGELAKGDSASAQCYGLGYQSQTGNQVNEHASENSGKGRQSKYWIYIPNSGGGYVVGAYLTEDDGTLNNLPQC
jgi:hypothetical protein